MVYLPVVKHAGSLGNPELNGGSNGAIIYKSGLSMATIDYRRVCLE